MLNRVLGLPDLHTEERLTYLLTLLFHIFSSHVCVMIVLSDWQLLLVVPDHFVVIQPFT